MYVGGFIGLVNSNGLTNRVNNCVALGDSLTSWGGSAQYVLRIYYSHSSTPAGNNNHAIDTMRIGRGAYNGTTLTPEDPIGDIGSTTHGGLSATVNDITNAAFWINTLRFNRDDSKVGLESITDIWDFTGIEGRGYPLLKGVGGQQ